MVPEAQAPTAAPAHGRRQPGPRHPPRPLHGRLAPEDDQRRLHRGGGAGPNRVHPQAQADHRSDQAHRLPDSLQEVRGGELSGLSRLAPGPALEPPLPHPDHRRGVLVQPRLCREPADERGPESAACVPGDPGTPASRHPQPPDTIGSGEADPAFPERPLHDQHPQHPVVCLGPVPGPAGVQNDDPAATAALGGVPRQGPNGRIPRPVGQRVADVHGVRPLSGNRPAPAPRPAAAPSGSAGSGAAQPDPAAHAGNPGPPVPQLPGRRHRAHGSKRRPAPDLDFQPHRRAWQDQGASRRQAGPDRPRRQRLHAPQSSI